MDWLKCLAAFTGMVEYDDSVRNHSCRVVRAPLSLFWLLAANTFAVKTDAGAHGCGHRNDYLCDVGFGSRCYFCIVRSGGERSESVC